MSTRIEAQSDYGHRVSIDSGAETPCVKNLKVAGNVSEINAPKLAGVRIKDGQTHPHQGIVEYLTGERNVVRGLKSSNTVNVVPGLAPGTAVATRRGEIAVECLRPGDRVFTRDKGMQDVVWVGSSSVSKTHLALEPDLRPVNIKANALGQGRPARDITVSPHHRILVADKSAQLNFGETEVLVAAKHLVGRAGIESAPVAPVKYVQFMCKAHQIVFTDGAWSETFHPSGSALDGLAESARREILSLFPELESLDGGSEYPVARRTLRKEEAGVLYA